MSTHDRPGYIDVLFRFRERRNEKVKLYGIFDRYKKEGQFKTAKSVLCIGPGAGEYDLEFIKRCLPAVEKISAVEMDSWCADEFQMVASKAFPRANVETFESKSEEWDSPDGVKFDLILAFHVLYEVEPEVRKTLIDKLFKDWLLPKGTLIYNLILDEYVEGGVNVISAFKKHLGHFRLVTTAQNMETMMEEGGGKIVEKMKYQCDIDYRKYDFDLLPLMQIYAAELTEESLKDMLAEVVPAGVGGYMVELCRVEHK